MEGQYIFCNIEGKVAKLLTTVFVYCSIYLLYTVFYVLPHTHTHTSDQE
jgi:hypothetical protein